VKRGILQIVLLLTMSAISLGQASQPPNLPILEGVVAKQFNDLRTKAGLNQLKFRRDIRLRMEACSVQVKGPGPKIEGARNVFWYLSADPTRANDDLVRLAGQKVTYDHVAVGVWFSRTEVYPSGMYWVVVSTEHGAAHEAFWSHFYLTDDFEYQTNFDKGWKKELPSNCGSIR
jgi:hypothetical protein